MSNTEGTILVRISRELAESIGTRTEDGRRLTWELGEPTETVIVPEGTPDPGAPRLIWEPVYTPTATSHDDGMRVVPVPEPHQGSCEYRCAECGEAPA